MDERPAIDHSERSATVIVMRGKTPVTINASDFKAGVDELAPDQVFPEGFTPPETHKASSGGKGGKAGGSGAAGGGGALDTNAYTIEEGGKFFRTDKDGKKLIDTPFDDQAAAAAAVIPSA